MASHLGPLKITCDAPPYDIVQACGGAGFRSPLDVRWCRMSHFLEDQAGRRRTASRFPWLAALGFGPPAEETCACGARLPDLSAFEFRHQAQVVGRYFLGQCPRCHTVFWEEA